MNSSPLRRVVEGVVVALIAMCAISGYLGLRAIVWRQEFMVAAMIRSGIALTAAIGGMIGAAYVLLGSWAWRVLRIDWMSIEFGALVGALLYGIYNVITPLSPMSRAETPLWRALQGGVEGVLIGAVVGAAVMFISGRPLHFDRFGLQRYLMLFVVVVLVAWVVVLIDGLIHVPDAVGIGIAIPLLLILRVAVARLDRHYSRYDNYGYDES